MTLPLCAAGFIVGNLVRSAQVLLAKASVSQSEDTNYRFDARSGSLREHAFKKEFLCREHKARSASISASPTYIIPKSRIADGPYGSAPKAPTDGHCGQEPGALKPHFNKNAISLEHT